MTNLDFKRKEMTEEEVLQKMEFFKNAIIALKNKNKALEEENNNLKNSTNDYNTKIVEKINEIDSILKA